MAGETNLSQLLATMRPVRRAGEYVFCTLPAGQASHLGLEPIGLFHEEEGLTVILPRAQAEAVGLPCDAIFAMITLTVHSSLEAVGFLAAIATQLASHGISVNPVSAFYHDHLFVPVAQAEIAMALLHELSQQHAP
ncbi:transporter [filamentous cyanobacterium CCT1]|nr:transporter [filamentous cyanobacterium CCT1]PSN80262.1 transporter [filamentous cyanobacterium CCP4]